MSDNNSTDDARDAGQARIAKVIARAGLASRRDAETWIADGRVTVNGEVITSPALNVGPRDRIAVDGKPLPGRERTRLWLYHKPRGLVTTAKDPEGRTTVFDVLPPELPRVVSVGRLDLNTEGLLLLTNDGGLARVLAHPSTGWLRRYRVRAFGDVDLAKLEALKQGIEIDGFSYGPIEAELNRKQGDNAWLTLGLREGKNREVRRVLEHLGLSVNRLIRVSFGPFQLGDLGEGAAEEIRTRYLRDQLGGLAEEAGCDFDAPIVDRTPEPVKRVLRARSAKTDEPRRTAGLTEDRKGRKVLVERVEADKTKKKELKPRGPRTGRPRDDRAEAPERGPDRGRFASRDARPPRRDGDAPRPFRAREDRPPRDARPPRRDDGRPFRKPGDRPDRGDRPERAERPQEPRPYGNRARVFRARPDRPEGEERRGPPRDRDSRRDGEGRPPRRDGEGRPPRRDGEGRPPRRDEGKPRSFGDKPRSFGDKPRSGGRPGAFAGKPGGRSSGGPGRGGPGRGGPGGKQGGRGGKPGGGRPGGGAPRGPRR